MAPIRLYQFLFTAALFCFRVNAQVLTPYTAYAQTGLDKISALVYKKGMGDYKSLYNGIEYIGSYPGTTGHPYFKWDTLQQGTIKYNGIYYPDVGLKYDLVSNEVILLGKQNLSISLVPQKIDFFSISGHLFIHLRQDSTIQQLPEAGFYEVLYDGRAMVLARRKKGVERASSVEDPFIFRQYNSFFVKRNNRFYPVNSEKELLLLFGDQKEALKKHLLQNGIKFRKEREKSIIQTVAFYDQLKN